MQKNSVYQPVSSDLFQRTMDEFDDLDDYLDEFEEDILSQEPGATVIPEDKVQSGEKVTNESIDDIARSLGMDEAFAENISQFMKQLDPNGNGLEAEVEKKGKIGGGFQDTINETINRLKSSSKQVEDETSEKFDKDEELLTTLLNSLDIGGDVGGLEGVDELREMLQKGDGEGIDQMSDVLMNMLNKLTSKEMMYETINTAVKNYEEYFADEEQIKDVSEDDIARYRAQLKHLGNVKETFDKDDYSEDNEKYRDFIDEEMENFNKVLPPPSGVIEDNLAQLGLENFKWNENDIPNELEGCVQQ